MSEDKEFRAASVDELVKVFAGFALQQDKAVLTWDVKTTNRLYHKLEAVEQELKSRDGDQRKALMTLYNHPNPQVRIKAAKATLALAPQSARRVLEEVAKDFASPQCLEAGMSLSNLDRGIYKPT